MMDMQTRMSIKYSPTTSELEESSESTSDCLPSNDYDIRLLFPPRRRTRLKVKVRSLLRKLSSNVSRQAKRPAEIVEFFKREWESFKADFLETKKEFQVLRKELRNELRSNGIIPRDYEAYYFANPASLRGFIDCEEVNIMGQKIDFTKIKTLLFNANPRDENRRPHRRTTLQLQVVFCTEIKLMHDAILHFRHLKEIFVFLNKKDMIETHQARLLEIYIDYVLRVNRERRRQMGIYAAYTIPRVRCVAPAEARVLKAEGLQERLDYAAFGSELYVD